MTNISTNGQLTYLIEADSSNVMASKIVYQNSNSPFFKGTIDSQLNLFNYTIRNISYPVENRQDLSYIIL